MRGGYGKREVSVMFVFPLLVGKFAGENRGDEWQGVDLYRDREKGGRKNLLCLYIPVFTVR